MVPLSSLSAKTLWCLYLCVAISPLQKCFFYISNNCHFSEVIPPPLPKSSNITGLRNWFTFRQIPFGSFSKRINQCGNFFFYLLFFNLIFSITYLQHKGQSSNKIFLMSSNLFYAVLCWPNITENVFKEMVFRSSIIGKNWCVWQYIFMEILRNIYRFQKEHKSKLFSCHTHQVPNSNLSFVASS